MTIEEFIGRLEEMRMRYSGDAEETLEKGAKRMVQELKKASPVGKGRHPHKLNKSWKCAIKGYRASDIRAEIRSTAPHFHLVNRGFQRVSPRGIPIQNSPRDNANLHFMEDTVAREWDGIRRMMAEDFFAKVRGKIG